MAVFILDMGPVNEMILNSGFFTVGIKEVQWFHKLLRDFSLVTTVVRKLKNVKEKLLSSCIAVSKNV